MIVAMPECRGLGTRVMAWRPRQVRAAFGCEGQKVSRFFMQLRAMLFLARLLTALRDRQGVGEG